MDEREQLLSLIISLEDQEEIERYLGQFLNESKAKAALLVDKSGTVIGGKGTASQFDFVTISALAAGAFSATQELAKLLGEEEFSLIFHQGKRNHLHISHIEKQVLLLVIFDDSTTLGMVRLFAQKACQNLAEIIKKIREKQKELPQVEIQFGDVEDFFKK
ncbi:MAG: MglB protein [Dictyoglomus sp. NZ13-RE01]|nr:MAG: MglB protein [Dictyoglomus sp. NZ13-RE01]